MNSKQLVILLLLVVVVGGAGLLYRQRQSSSWEGSNAAIGKKLLGDLPVNDITHIAMKQGTNALDLVKKDDLWRVQERGDYPANYSEISDFLVKLRDIKVVQSEKVGPSQLPRLALVPGQGTNAALVVDFKGQGDKQIGTLLLGKKHMKKGQSKPSPYGGMEEGWPDGRYVKVGADSETVAVISDALANIEPKPEQWLNKDFFKIEKVRSVAVEAPNPTNSWKLSRETETGEWKLADAKPTEQLDSSKTSGVANQLSSPTFNDVAAGMKPEGLEKPTVATVETFDNFSYTLKVGQKTNEICTLAISVAANLPKERTPGKDEKPEDKDRLDKEFKEKQKKLEDKLAQEKGFEKWVYLVSSWTVDPVLKERSQLMVEKKDEKKDAAASEAPAPGAPLNIDPTALAPSPTPPATPKSD